jgi:hypothetical protein
MDSSSDVDLGGLIFLGLVLVAVAAIVYVVLIVVMVVAYLVLIAAAVTVVVGLLIALGIGANLLVRAVVGVIGDQMGATPQVAQVALVTVMTAPMPIITTGLLLVAVMGSGEASLVWLAIFLVSWPAYYWVWEAHEIPRLHWKLELPFKTEAAMRAEERILIVQMKSEFVQAYVRTRLFLWGRWADFKAWLANKYQITTQFLSKVGQSQRAIRELQVLRDKEEENGPVSK